MRKPEVSAGAAFLSVILAAPGTAGAAGLVHLTLPAHAAVDGPRILLGEIAACESLLPSRCEYLSTIDLGAAAAPGESVTIRREEVIAILSAESGGAVGADASAGLEAPVLMRVITRSQQPDPAAVRKVLEDFAIAEFGPEKVRLAFEQLSLVTPVHLPVGAGGYRSPDLEAASGNGLPWFHEKILKTRKVVFEFHPESTDGIQPPPVQFTVSLKAKVETEVYVASHTLGRGARVGASDVTSAWKAYAGEAVQGATLKQIVGRDLKRGVRLGQAFASDDFARPVAARRGMKVKVRLESGGLTILGEGALLEGAGIGDAVPVEVMPGRRRMSGTLAADDLVIVRRL